MKNKPSTWVVTRLRGITQEFLSEYHITMSDHATGSTWSAEEYCAIQFSEKQDADAVSDRFPGSFVQEYMEYEDDER